MEKGKTPIADGIRHPMMQAPRNHRKEEERLAELAAAGLVTPGSGERLTPFEPLRIPGASPLSKTLLDDRNDRL